MKIFSTLTEEIIDLGLPEQNLDELLELGAFVATGHPDVIVFFDEPDLGILS